MAYGDARRAPRIAQRVLHFVALGAHAKQDEGAEAAARDHQQRIDPEQGLVVARLALAHARMVGADLHVPHVAERLAELDAAPPSRAR